VLVETAADVDRARQEDKVSIAFDVEGMTPLDEGDNGLIQLFYDLGVRWMLIAYNRKNAAGGGCLDDDDPGLSAHGRAMLAEMKRVGMVVCCSHTGHRTGRDVMANADNPVIFSHSNASAVWSHYRNIPDELIKACAATGGVVGVNGIGIFLGENDARPELVFRHIDHMVQLVGPDHVGLALDYVFARKSWPSFSWPCPTSFPWTGRWPAKP
jgi:membrane dipeptidase